MNKLSIDSFPIKKVSQTRFLGVIIDEDLSWDPHIAATRRKLNYAASSLYRMRDSIPSNLHKDLYHTLYESHLAYCISVWGGASPSKTGCLLISQKQCIRFLFGDKEAFLNKFRTCARARPVKIQLLGEEFYSREHTKPLFDKHKILSFMNLYTYHTYMELFKILKFRDPLVIHEQFKVSNRKSNLLINNFPAKNFVSRSTGIWNTITPKLKLVDNCTAKVASTKNILKNLLLRLQNDGDPVSWNSDNFNLDKMPSR